VILTITRSPARFDRDFLKRIEEQYGKAERIWVMDRGIPTEEALKEMRETSVFYLVGTPKGRLARYEKELAGRTLSAAADRRTKALRLPLMAVFAPNRRCSNSFSMIL